MLKKATLIIYITILIFSCGKQAPEKMDHEEISEAVMNQSDLLASSDDVVIDPSEPLLDDVLLLSKSPATSFDSKAFSSLFNRTKEGEQNLLKSSPDFSSLTVNYFNADDFDFSSLVSPDSVGPLKLVDFGPAGELPIEMRKPTIYVLFNQAMVPVSKLGEPVKDSLIMSISPAVTGTYRWMGTKMLSFEPDEPMIRNRDVEVTIHKGTTSVFGKELPIDFKFLFHNEFLEIVRMAFGTSDDLHDSYYEVPPQKAKSIWLTFNQTVEASALDGYITVSDDFKNYAVQVETPAPDTEGWSGDTLKRMVLVTINEDLPFNSEIKVQLQEGARANNDSSPREDSQLLTYKTLSPFSYSDYSRYSYSFPRDPEGVQNPVFLTFSHPLNKETVLENLSTSFPDIDLTSHVEVFDSTIRIAGLPVEYESEYSVFLKGGIEDLYGRSLDLEKTIVVDVPEAASYSYFPGSDGIRSLEAQFDPKIIYEYQNVDKGSFSINGVAQDPGFDTAKRNEANYKLVDLSSYLNGSSYGSVYLKWDFEESYINWKNEEKTRRNDREMKVQVTDLAISTRYSYNKFLIWVNSLSTGEAASGATVTLSGKNGFYGKAIADDDGFASIELDSGDLADYFYESNQYRYTINITAELNGDRVDLPVQNTQSGWRFGISSSSPVSAEDSIPRVFMFSDRGLYKPGETLTFRGMDWNQHLGEFSPYVGPYKITIEELRGYDSKELVSWSGNTTESGGFFNSYDISPEQDPVDLRILYERGEHKFEERVKVANFRRLNFQAQLKTPERKYFTGDKINIPLEASYLSGGALAEGDLTSYWTRMPVRYRPPGDVWKYSAFGPSVGWLHENVLTSDHGKLTVQGTANLSIESTDHSLKGMAYRYVVEATVEDIDRQTVSVASSVLVHPATYYIGASIKDQSSGRWRRFVPVNEEIQFVFNQVDVEGNLYTLNSSAEIEVIKGSYKAIQQNSIGGRVNTRYEWIEETLFTGSVNWQNSKTSINYTPEQSGSYRLRISSRDKNDREVITDLEFYVSGGSWVRWAGQNAEDITLDVEQNVYFPGDTARILVKSPLEKGRYMLTIEREGILEEKLLDLDPSNPFIDIEIKEDWIPVMYVTLTSFMARSDQPDSYFDPDFGKPKGIFGAASLNISTKSRELDIEVLSDKAVYRPGEKAEITVRVTKNGEAQADTEITYLAVDRGVLDLINYHIPNPLNYFYSRNHFRLFGAGDDSRRMLLTPVTYDVSNLTGGDGEDGKLQRREDFTPLAIFEPFLKTDENGEVRIQMDWPDTLTTYRSTVIALKGDKIGYLEKELFVKNPINVRAAIPRQLRVRDTAFAGVVITNIDGVDHEVKVNASSQILGLPDNREKVVTVPAGRSYEVAFVLEAKEAGEGELIFTIHSDVLNEELVQTIKVEKPLIKESFTTTGIVKAEEELKEEALIIPSGIGESYGALNLSIDSSQAPFLRDQLFTLSEHKIYDYTFDYLYSALPGIIAPAVTKGIGSDFEATAKQNLISFIKILKNRQREDGGIASSASLMNYSSHPFVSLVSMHMIQILKKQKQDYEAVVDESALFSYLSNYGTKYNGDLYFNVYLHYIKALAGEFDQARTDEFLSLGDELGISGYALLAYVYELEGREGDLQKIYRKIKNFVSMGTQGVDIKETYESRYYFDSMYQQLSHLLRLGIKAGEVPEILNRYTFSLNQDKNSRNWLNSHDRMWIGLALSDLVRTEKFSDIKFEAEVVINEDTIMKGRFQGLSRGPQEKGLDLFKEIIPISGQNTLSSLQFRKIGTGTLFYTTTLKYALPNEVAMMRDEGLSVFSQIENMDGDVLTNNELELGETYRMRVLLNTSKSRSFVNLTVPIPSGAEIVDPGFSTSSAYKNKGGVSSESWTRESEYGDEETYIGEGYIIDGYFYPFTPNQLIFNQEIRYSWDSLYSGQREISFLFRCTTPGIYPTPPATADLLFEPEVFGRDKGRLIVIH
jgi:uncharacterized protein YfaS (alpha-2-macroglobulin family)